MLAAPALSLNRFRLRDHVFGSQSDDWDEPDLADRWKG
jgi:hypothetical protein